MKLSTFAIAAVYAVLPGFGVHGAELAGRYVVASVPPTPGATVAEAVYGGTVNVARRGQTVNVTWQLDAPGGSKAGARRLRGIGLADADGAILGVSLATGGRAYGVGVYRHDPQTHEWVGRWITSLDGGGGAGDIRFDDGGGVSQLAGRHRLTARRAGSGGYEGAVSVAAAGEDNYRFTFEAGRAVLYRGVGVRLGADRLAVAWSFGSAPALAAYQVGADGLLTGQRVGGGGLSAAREALAREGADAARLLPVAARSPADPTLLPGSPQVRNWNYEELQARYGAAGWAGRWLEGQLSREEHGLLDRALRRQQARLAKGGAAERRTIGELIEGEKRR